MSFAAVGVFAGAAFLRAARSAAATLFVSAIRIGRTGAAAAEGAAAGVGSALGADFGATFGSALARTAGATAVAGFTWRLIAAAGSVPFEVAGVAAAALAVAVTGVFPIEGLAVSFLVIPILAPALIGAFLLGAFTIGAFVTGAFDVATLVVFAFKATAAAVFDEAALPPLLADDAGAETMPFGAAADRAGAGPRAVDRAALSVVRWAVFARDPEAVAGVFPTAFPALAPKRAVVFFNGSRTD